MLVWPYFARARERWHDFTSLFDRQHRSDETIPHSTTFGSAERPRYFKVCDVRCQHCFTRLHQKIPSKDYVGQPITCRCGRITLVPAGRNYVVHGRRYWNYSKPWSDSEAPKR